MLILGRRANQSIVFPNCGITVRILDVNGRVAKVGIEAPRSVEIMRGELAMSAASSSKPTSSVSPNNIGYEQADAPESGPAMLQFAQRLSDLKSSLHIFQQMRAAGNEAGADEVLAELLHDLATLDNDWLKSQLDGEVADRRTSHAVVSESKNDYVFSSPKSPKPRYLLIVDENHADSSAGVAVHGCQTCTVNSQAAAMRALDADEPIDYIVCNGNADSFDQAELVQSIRANPKLDGAKIFVTTNSKSAVEQLAVANQHGIDGWLDAPLCPQNLWNHIVESSQFEI